MSDATTAIDTTKSVVKEIGVIAAKSAATAVVEVVAATAILATAGFVAVKLQERKARKLAAQAE